MTRLRGPFSPTLLYFLERVPKKHTPYSSVLKQYGLKPAILLICTARLQVVP